MVLIHLNTDYLSQLSELHWSDVELQVAQKSLSQHVVVELVGRQ